MGRDRKYFSVSQVWQFWSEWALSFVEDDGSKPLLPCRTPITDHARSWCFSFVDTIYTEHPRFCFGCRVERPASMKLQKAHIKALAIGGLDNIHNIHLLCGQCHKHSEGFHGERYYRWLDLRRWWHSRIQVILENGRMDQPLAIAAMAYLDAMERGDRDVTTALEQYLSPHSKVFESMWTERVERND